MTVWAPLPFGELIVELFPHFVDARLRRVANFPTSDELWRPMVWGGCHAKVE